MGKAYATDPRGRVVAAGERDGLSRDEAAARFGVAVSTAIDWVRRYRETGSVAPGRIGGSKPLRPPNHTLLRLRSPRRSHMATLNVDPA